MGNSQKKKIGLLSVEEELKLHISAPWDLLRLQQLSISKQPKDLQKNILATLVALQPTLEEFLQARFSEQYWITWKGYVASIQNSQDPQPFFHQLVSHVEAKKAILSSLNISNINFIVILKIYVSLCAIEAYKSEKNENLKKNLEWLKERVLQMRKILFQITTTYLTERGDWTCYNYQDAFTYQQFKEETNKPSQYYTQIKSTKQQVLNNWNEYLSSLRKK